MSFHFRVLVLVVLAVITTTAGAESSFARFLVPVSILDPVPGANGSVWTTDFTVRNNSSAPVHVRNIFPLCPGILCGGYADIPPSQTVFLVPEGGSSTNGPGAIIEIASDAVDDVTFNLRVQDLSRQSSTWGTELPVVKESDLLAGPGSMVNIPYGEDFRHTLRLYEIDGSFDPEVDLLLYAAEPGWVGYSVPPQPDRLLGSKRFRLMPPPLGWEGRAPSYLELGDLNEIAQIGSAQRLVVQVVPVKPGMRYWAFISVTNNETQHVTTILP